MLGSIAIERPVGPFCVVGVLEFGELGLELSDGLGGWSGVEPPFLGLVKPLNLPLSLGVPRGTVFLANTECCQEVFKAVSAAGESGGVNTSVVGQGGRWQPVVVNVLGESIDDYGAGDARVGVQGEEEPGVVIEPVDDFNVGAISEPPVGEIRLPTLVGLVGFEANVGGFGAFPGFRDDQPGAFQDTTDRGARRRGRGLLEESVSDGLRTCIETISAQLVA